MLKCVHLNAAETNSYCLQLVLVMTPHKGREAEDLNHVGTTK